VYLVRVQYYIASGVIEHRANFFGSIYVSELCKIHVFPAAWRARPFFLERRRAPSKRRKTVFYPNKQSLTITQMHGASRASRRVPTVPAGKRALVSRCPTAVPPCCSLFSIPRPLPVSSHNSIRSCDYCGH
jgi:hypothetical protein